MSDGEVIEDDDLTDVLPPSRFERLAKRATGGSVRVGTLTERVESDHEYRTDPSSLRPTRTEALADKVSRAMGEVEDE